MWGVGERRGGRVGGGSTYPFLLFVVRGGGCGERRRRGERVRRAEPVKQMVALVEIRARRGPLRGHCNQHTDCHGGGVRAGRVAGGGWRGAGGGGGAGAGGGWLVGTRGVRTSCGGAASACAAWR